MTSLSSRPGTSRATVETLNALKAETFHKLPDDIPLWRFREVLLRLRKFLGLSDGAVTYALDVMGLLTEADWRGDGRPVTYTSVRGYARKVEKCERTIGNYEAQLIAAGLVHRTIRHARRHGGQGHPERRTGLDWRAFGVMMPDLLARLDRRDAENRRCLDLEARIRTEKRLIRDLAEGLGQGRAQTVEAKLMTLGVMPLRACLCAAELEPILTALTLLRGDLAEEAGVDKPTFYPPAAVQSESSCTQIDSTRESSSPMEIRICNEKKESRKSRPSTMKSAQRPPLATTKRASDSIPLDRLWQIAPNQWKAALGDDVSISWPAMIEVAAHSAAYLEVSPSTWNQALRVLGPSEAALALMVLTINQNHPTRPVRSVGAALTGMIKRAGQGTLNLTPSLYGIMARSGVKNCNHKVSHLHSS